MTEEAQPSIEPEVAASEPTLDDVISEFNIGQPVQTQQPVEVPTEQTFAPQAPQEYAPQTEIDVYDPNSIQSFVDNRVNGQQQALNQLQSQVDQMRQKETDLQVNADIKQAVGVLTSNIDGLDPDMAESFLEMKARKDPSFKSIWDNRSANPQALEKAMGIISSQAKNMFSVKPNEQLVENQRAMQQSIQTNTNQAAVVNSLEEQLNAASSLEERDRIRQQLMKG